MDEMAGTGSDHEMPSLEKGGDLPMGAPSKGYAYREYPSTSQREVSQGLHLVK